MLHGARNMADEIPMIESYLGVRLELSPPIVPVNIECRRDYRSSAQRREFLEAPAVPMSFSAALMSSCPEGAVPLVPVYGYAAGSLQTGLNLSGSEAVDWVTRHPAQFGVRDAFAIYAFSDEMTPRYFQGELVYIHPCRPPQINRDCVIVMKNGDACIKHFLRQNEKKIRIAQFNPPEEKDIPRGEIKAIYAVVGRG